MNEYFASRRTLIDEFLASLAGASEQRAASSEQGHSPLLAARYSQLASVPETLRKPLQRSLTLPGKRVRGVLVMAAAEASGLKKPDKILGAAAALEMIHSSSLILDDLPSMDDALMRRGAPTLHREFGEDLAILTAVALLNHAYGLVAENYAVMKPRRWPMQRVIGRVVEAVGWNGSVAGEAVDLHSGASKLDFDTLEFIHSRKTGALFVASAAVGGMLANIHPAPLQRIEVFAKNLGLAFQITDDILDVTADAEQLGKDVGKDEQRLTFVKLAGVEGAKKLSRELVETSLAAISNLGPSAAPLRDLAVLVRDRVR